MNHFMRYADGDWDYRTHPEHIALTQAIHENPTEANNHLIHADWLDEMGQPEEALFRRSMADWFENGGHTHREHDFMNPGIATFPFVIHPKSPLPAGINLLESFPPMGHQRNNPEGHLPRVFQSTGRYAWETYPDMEEAFRQAFHQARGQQRKMNQEREDQSGEEYAAYSADEMGYRQPVGYAEGDIYHMDEHMEYSQSIPYGWNGPFMHDAPRGLFNLSGMSHHKPSAGHPPTGSVPYADENIPINEHSEHDRVIAGFHRALHLDPHDATAALAYSDWLEENGQPEFAEVIRLHVQQQQELEDRGIRTGGVGAYGGFSTGIPHQINITGTPGRNGTTIIPRLTVDQAIHPEVLADDPHQLPNSGHTWRVEGIPSEELHRLARGLIAKGAKPYPGSHWQEGYEHSMGSWSEPHERIPYPQEQEPEPEQLSRYADGSRMGNFRPREASLDPRMVDDYRGLFTKPNTAHEGADPEEFTAPEDQSWGGFGFHGRHSDDLGVVGRRGGYPDANLRSFTHARRAPEWALRHALESVEGMLPDNLGEDPDAPTPEAAQVWRAASPDWTKMNQRRTIQPVGGGVYLPPHSIETLTGREGQMHPLVLADWLEENATTPEHVEQANELRRAFSRPGTPEYPEGPSESEIMQMGLGPLGPRRRESPRGHPTQASRYAKTDYAFFPPWGNPAKRRYLHPQPVRLSRTTDYADGDEIAPNDEYGDSTGGEIGHEFPGAWGPSHRDFHAKMRENDKEITSALAYADWLQEQGFDHQAEIVRADVQQYGSNGVAGYGVHPLIPREGDAFFRVNPEGYDSWTKKTPDHYTVQLHMNSGLPSHFTEKQRQDPNSPLSATTFAAIRLDPHNAYRLMEGLRSEGVVPDQDESGVENWGHDILRKHVADLAKQQPPTQASRYFSPEDDPSRGRGLTPPQPMEYADTDGMVEYADNPSPFYDAHRQGDSTAMHALADSYQEQGDIRGEILMRALGLTQHPQGFVWNPNEYTHSHGTVEGREGSLEDPAGAHHIAATAMSRGYGLPPEFVEMSMSHSVPVTEEGRRRGRYLVNGMPRDRLGLYPQHTTRHIGMFHPDEVYGMVDRLDPESQTNLLEFLNRYFPRSQETESTQEPEQLSRYADTDYPQWWLDEREESGADPDAEWEDVELDADDFECPGMTSYGAVYYAPPARGFHDPEFLKQLGLSHIDPSKITRGGKGIRLNKEQFRRWMETQGQFGQSKFAPSARWENKPGWGIVPANKFRQGVGRNWAQINPDWRAQSSDMESDFRRDMAETRQSPGGSPLLNPPTGKSSAGKITPSGRVYPDSMGRLPIPLGAIRTPSGRIIFNPSQLAGGTLTNRPAGPSNAREVQWQEGMSYPGTPTAPGSPSKPTGKFEGPRPQPLPPPRTTLNPRAETHGGFAPRRGQETAKKIGGWLGNKMWGVKNWATRAGDWAERQLGIGPNAKQKQTESEPETGWVGGGERVPNEQPPGGIRGSRQYVPQNRRGKYSAYSEYPTDYAEPHEYPDYQQMLQAVHANPLEATAHHALADWLEENGFADEGAFRRSMANWIKETPPQRPKTNNDWRWRIHGPLIPPDQGGAVFPQGVSGVSFRNAGSNELWSHTGEFLGDNPEEFHHAVWEGDFEHPGSFSWYQYPHMEEALRQNFMENVQRHRLAMAHPNEVTRGLEDADWGDMTQSSRYDYDVNLGPMEEYAADCGMDYTSMLRDSLEQLAGVFGDDGKPKPPTMYPDGMESPMEYGRKKLPLILDPVVAHGAAVLDNPLDDAAMQSFADHLADRHGDHPAVQGFIDWVNNSGTEEQNESWKRLMPHIGPKKTQGYMIHGPYESHYGMSDAEIADNPHVEFRRHLSDTPEGLDLPNFAKRLGEDFWHQRRAAPPSTVVHTVGYKNRKFTTPEVVKKIYEQLGPEALIQMAIGMRYFHPDKIEARGGDRDVRFSRYADSEPPTEYPPPWDESVAIRPEMESSGAIRMRPDSMDFSPSSGAGSTVTDAHNPYPTWGQIPPSGLRNNVFPIEAWEDIGDAAYTRYADGDYDYQTHPEHIALTQAIHEDPLEATRHLIHADWLDEMGQHDEADFRRAMAEWVVRGENAPDPFRPPGDELKSFQVMEPTSGEGIEPSGFTHSIYHAHLPDWAGTVGKVGERHHDLTLDNPSIAYHPNMYWYHWRGYPAMEQGLRRAFHTERELERQHEAERESAPPPDAGLIGPGEDYAAYEDDSYGASGPYGDSGGDRNGTTDSDHEGWMHGGDRDYWRGGNLGYSNYWNESPIDYDKIYTTEEPIQVGEFEVEPHFFPEETDRLIKAKEDTQRDFRKMASSGIGGQQGTLPTLPEVTSLAELGDPVRGSYDDAYQTMEHLFKSPQDAHRWVTANAILSAQTGWRDHTAGALEAMAKWHAMGRPVDPDKLDELFGSTYVDPRTGATRIDQRGLYGGPDTLTGSKVESLKSLFGSGEDFPGTQWDQISENSFKTPNFGLAFVDPRGVPIDTHMAKMMTPGGKYTNARIQQIANGAGVDEATKSGLLEAQKKLASNPASVLAYKTLIAKAASDLGWEPREVQEAVWVASLAVSVAKNMGASPKAKSILSKLNRQAIQAGWSLNTVLRDPEIHDHLKLMGISPRRVLNAIEQSERRLPAGTGRPGTSDPSALESVSSRLPGTVHPAAVPIRDVLSRG